MKKIVALITMAILLVVCAFALVACGSDNQDAKKFTEIYNLYVEDQTLQGQVPKSYNEWLNSVKGKDGKDGDTPRIINNTWWIGDVDTGVKARATDGKDGKDGTNGYTPQIGENGNWFINGIDTGKKGVGTDGLGIKQVKLIYGELIIVFTDNSQVNLGKIINEDSLTIFEIGLLDDDTYIIYGCKNKAVVDLKIPESIFGVMVTEIADKAFNGLEKLESISFSKNIRSIGDKVFIGLESLQSITVDSLNTIYKSVDNCLIDIANKELVLGCENSVIPTDGSVTKIKDFAFSEDAFYQVQIPSVITYVGRQTFWSKNY